MEIWNFDESDSDLLDDYYVVDAWDLIGSLADSREVDMYDAEQCAKLAPWLGEQIKRTDLPPRLIELYVKLKEFSERAVVLGTGVVIAL